jgi:hypothetical protein
MRIFVSAIAVVAFARNVHGAAGACGDGDVNAVFAVLEACSLSSFCSGYLHYTTSISTGMHTSLGLNLLTDC